MFSWSGFFCFDTFLLVGLLFLGVLVSLTSLFGYQPLDFVFLDTFLLVGFLFFEILLSITSLYGYLALDFVFLVMKNWTLGTIVEDSGIGWAYVFRFQYLYIGQKHFKFTPYLFSRFYTSRSFHWCTYHNWSHSKLL